MEIKTCTSYSPAKSVGEFILMTCKGNDVLLDEEDYIRFKNFRIFELQRYPSIYIWENGKRKTYALHRLILDAQKGEMVDHRNQDRLDNRRENLRKCTATQNSANMKLSTLNTTGFKGVTYKKDFGKYRACIRINKISKHLGYFTTAKEAALVYNKKALEIFGEFAWLNPIPN